MRSVFPLFGALFLVFASPAALAQERASTGVPRIVYADLSAVDLSESSTDSSAHIEVAQVLDTGEALGYSAVLAGANGDDVSTPRNLPAVQMPVRAIQPVAATRSAASSRVNIDVFDRGKLLLTNGVATVEGTSGGGIATWATIAGRELDGGVGASAHFTAIELPDFGWRSYGVSLGVADRIELSYARQNFDTRSAGAILGLGQSYTFNQDVYGAKLRVAGDVVYGATLFPQIAVGVEYKRNLDGPIVALLGAGGDEGVDYTLSATKIFLEHSLLISATARYTEANQLGLLGFGSAAGEGYELQFEGSLAYQLSRRAVFGVEYRSKPDNLGLGEDDWLDIFAAYALTENITVSAAYVDLGSIATFEDQRGGFLQAQVAF